MTHHNETHSKDTETPKRVFVSRTQVLSEEQHGALSEKEKEFEKAARTGASGWNSSARTTRVLRWKSVSASPSFARTRR